MTAAATKKNAPVKLEDIRPADLDAGQLFSGKPSGFTIRGYKLPCEFTPEKNRDYQMQPASRDVIVWFMSEPEPLYIYGPTGCGKTSLIKNIAARLNYPAFEVTGHSRLEFPEMVGHLTVKDKEMIFQYGPLALAMKYGGLFLLNEIDLLDPSTAAGLNSILDGSPLCIPENGGEIIKPHPMFRFAATGNTNGAADETGLYSGCLRQNLAFMDRFFLCKLDYPPKDIEIALISKKHPELASLAGKMVEFANEVRGAFMGTTTASAAKSLDITFSTRTLLRWANLILRFDGVKNQKLSPLIYALDRSLGFRASTSNQAYLHEMAQRIFNL